jgi:quercetin dioxygenase-like cupin family protein
MAIVKQAEITPEVIGAKRTRYLAHTDKLMLTVIDFNDGPTDKPDPPHAHPHEQVSYVVAGEVLFFLDGRPHRLGPGDLVTVAPNVPHTVQLLTQHVRLVDAFHPIRSEFLKPE